MTTIRESLNSWIENNYSFCKDNNTICDKFPIESKLIMIEATKESNIPHWPEGEEGIEFPTYTEYAASIKDNLTLGTLVKEEGEYKAIAPRTEDTVGTFYTHAPGTQPGLSPSDIVDALIHNDKVTCVGTPRTSGLQISCYTRKDPQWSKWRELALKIRDDGRDLNKAITEVFRDEKTGKPLTGRKLRRVLEGTEPYYYKGPAMQPIAKRLGEIDRRLTELQGFRRGPRLGDIELGLIARSEDATKEQQKAVLAEQDTLRDKRKVILEQIKEIGDIANIYNKILKLRARHELVLKEIAERIGMRLRNGKTSSLEIEADNIYGEILELRDRRNAILKLGDIESLQEKLGDIDDKLLELQEEYDYFKSEEVMLEKKLRQEAESLQKEERELHEELDKIRAEEEKDKPDPEKYRKWQVNYKRKLSDFYQNVHEVASATMHGYYLGSGIYPPFEEFITKSGSMITLTESLKKYMIERGFEEGYKPLIERGQPSFIDDCVLYKEEVPPEYKEFKLFEKKEEFERFLGSPKKPERAEKSKGLEWPEKSTWIERYRSFFREIKEGK